MDQPAISAADMPPSVAQCSSTATAQWLLTSQLPTDQPVAHGVAPDPKASTTQTTSTTETTAPPTASPPTDTATPQEKLPPTQAEFRVPTNKIEHKLMVQRLVNGGSLLAEAEQTIAARKAAFNKALRKFKKEQTPKNHNNAKKCNLHFGE